MTAAEPGPDRAAGYVTDLGYTWGYHPELNPSAARLAFLRAGLEPPQVATACELGFGQGVSLAVHAAAGPARWWGCDLLPDHVHAARMLDEAAGSGSVLVEASFEEFAARDDLPPFDFVALHGVLSWVSAGNRARIAAFLRERLAPGGIVYTSHNALPAWTELLPLRRLMVEHATGNAGAGAGTAARIEAALAFAGRVLDEHPLGLRGLPGLPGAFARLRGADRRYLAHEYFNRDWAPLWFGDVADLLAGVGLAHACAARLRDQLDELNLTAGQRALLAATDGPRLRETLRDVLAGTAVRRDYWARAPRALGAGALRKAWGDTRLARLAAAGEVPERVSGPQGELRPAGPLHRALLDALAAGGPRTLGELQADGALPPGDAPAAAFELAALGHLAVAQDDDAIAACAPRAQRLNARLAGTPGIAVRASAVTGGGVPAGAGLSSTRGPSPARPGHDDAAT
jgi:hypothetical protein